MMRNASLMMLNASLTIVNVSLTIGKKGQNFAKNAVLTVKKVGFMGFDSWIEKMVLLVT